LFNDFSFTEEKMKKVRLFIVVTLLLLGISLIGTPAYAEPIGSVALMELYLAITENYDAWVMKAADIAFNLLGITAVIGFAIGLKDLAVSAGQITLDGIVALFVRYAFIVGLLVWLLKLNPLGLTLIHKSIRAIGASISGTSIQFGEIMALFNKIVVPLVDFTAGLGWTDVGLIICMTFIVFLINCLFFLFLSTVIIVEFEAFFIIVGGMFTASFFVIGYFRDMFLGYIKALAAVGVKMLMLCLCLGIMKNIMTGWVDLIASRLSSGEGVFAFLVPMSSAILGFYMIVKAVPQYAASVMTGSASGMDGGMVRAAAMAGYGLGATVVSSSRFAAQKLIGGASTVIQASQAYQHTSQAARDTGSTPGEAKAAGAREAFSTVMTGTGSGGSRSGGERIYSDSQRAAQYADVRAPANANALSSPASQAASGSGESSGRTSGNVTIADYNAAANATQSGSGAKDSSGSDSWGVFASDRKETENGGGKKA
jgi:type IV secretory pathway TrbL component